MNLGVNKLEEVSYPGQYVCGRNKTMDRGLKDL